MQPEITQLDPMTLVGLVATGQNVGDIDIAGLWQRFIAQSEMINHQVDPGKGYEYHLQIDDPTSRHLTLIGAAVEKVEILPPEMLAKILPGGTYARFTHHFKEGGFGEAFKQVYGWIDESAYQFAHPFDIQVYDERFIGHENPESVVEILVPLRQR